MASPFSIRSRWWLTVFIVSYVIVSIYLSNLRYLEFATSNWDLGIFQQGLWTTGHAHLLFYEAGDWETLGTSSFLEVHTSLILFFLVPVYYLVPSPETLFITQSVIVGLASVPIYLIARRLLWREGVALAFAGLYLANGALLAANLFDFHVEAFLPLEIAGLFYLWMVGRYRLGILVAILAILTIEVAPFLVVVVALFFLFPPFYPPLRNALRGAIARRRPGRPAPSPVPEEPTAPASAFRSSQVRWSMALIVIVMTGYALLRLTQWVLLPLSGLGHPSPPPGSHASGLGPAGIPLSLALVHLVLKARYWFILVALFGFLPLLAPRALFLTAPWFLFTLQSPQISWILFGNQYSFIALCTLMIAAMYGYRNLEIRVLPWLARARARRAERRAARVGAVTPRFPALTRPSPFGGRRLARPVALAALAVLVAANLAFGPINPYQQNPRGGLPGYAFSYTIVPGFSSVATLAEMIPGNATVLASSNLFPFVANNPNAYALPWTTTVVYQIPFSGESLPQWVFLSENEIAPAPVWLAGLLLNPAVYGVRAVVWTTPAGTVLLYEHGFNGAITSFGSPPSLPYNLTGTSLNPVQHGQLVPIVGGPTPEGVQGTNDSGNPFFVSQPVSLAPGEWTLNIWVAREPTVPDPPIGPGPPGYSLKLNLTAFGYDPWLGVYYYNQSSPIGVWNLTSVNFSVPYPTLNVQVTGTVLRSGETYVVAMIQFKR